MKRRVQSGAVLWTLFNHLLDLHEELFPDNVGVAYRSPSCPTNHLALQPISK